MGAREPSVPIVDFLQLADGRGRAGAVQAFGDGLRDAGLVVVRNAPVDRPAFAAHAQAMEELFARIDPERLKKFDLVSQHGVSRGYKPRQPTFPMRMADGTVRPRIDYRHIWISGPDHNVYPKEFPEFARTSGEVYAGVRRLADSLVGVLGDYLDDGEGRFAAMFLDEHGRFKGNAHLWSILYEPFPKPEVDALGPGEYVIRNTEHVDNGAAARGVGATGPLFTLLCSATQPGLQIRNSDGQWIDVPEMQGSIVVKAAFVVQEITRGLTRNGKSLQIRAVWHRVVGDRHTGRLPRCSTALFVRPDPGSPLWNLGTGEILRVTERDRGIVDLPIDPALRLSYAREISNQVIDPIAVPFELYLERCLDVGRHVTKAMETNGTDGYLRL
jgi:isopenicillin N synthase-like dioxygenase